MFRRKPRPWEWPADLARYARFGGHAAVALRIADINLLSKGWGYDRRIDLPREMFGPVADGLPPQVLYMDTKLADEGIANLMLKNIVFTGEGSWSRSAS